MMRSHERIEELIAFRSIYGLDPQEQQLKDGMVPGDDGYGVEPPERWGAIIRGGKRLSGRW